MSKIISFRIHHILFFLYIISTPVFAWNSVGHRIIAQIAYDQLTPQAKVKVDALTKVMFHSRYASARFSRASTWPDYLRQKTNQYDTWHFINLPIIKEGVKASPVNQHNVVWAITQSEKILKNSNANQYERAKTLSFLIHFVGDIEQPLHCATLYSDEFPQGDRGGNDYAIHSDIADNLHQFWDKGAGLFVSPSHHYIFHYQQIDVIAKNWMAGYPRSYFKSQLSEQSPMQWAEESHQIAVNFVYTLPLHAMPSPDYIHKGQMIVREQCVLAGDRLADVLNGLF